MTNNKFQKKFRRAIGRAGFTMAEVLIVVAIIGVLSGVAFVAVQSHQKSLQLAEMDSIAKEIFVAAQNHLLMAENEKYLGNTQYGETFDATNGIFYFSVKNGDKFGQNKLIDQMLPFGSVDETVRAGGSYIIFYQPEAALVLDVLYTDGDHTFTADDRASFAGESNRNSRKGNTPIVGWYGSYGIAGNGIAQIAEGTRLEQPTILVENAEKLRVTVTDPNQGITTEDISLVLIVSELDLNGVETGEKKAITLRAPTGRLPDTEYLEEAASNGIYKIILDDISTSGKHFAALESDTTPTEGFVPGSDISVQAIAYNTAMITNIAYSDIEITNSLFESISADSNGVVTASINNIRHLENLEEDISGLIVGTGDNQINLKNAIQTSDISWTTFKGKLNGTSTRIYPLDSESDPTTADCYMPVSPGYSIIYNGQNHNVYDIKATNAGACGLFGILVGGTEIKNLALHDFNITSTGTDTSGEVTVAGDAGALAGSMTNATVINVVAYNTGTDRTATITGTGSVGGLIGKTTGCTVRKSAAALVIKTSQNASGNAGGLIGSSSGGTVTASYSGGHTDQAEYYAHNAGVRTTAIYNVTGGTYAGGLIGDAGDTQINQCYSTCSATGATAGGLVGTASGNITKSYCTGLVSGTTAQGAFSGAYSGTASECLFFEIINEIPDTATGGVRYLGAVGDEEDPNITPFDKDAGSYNDFSWPGNVTECPWQGAVVYDKNLITYYGETGSSGRSALYSLQTVKQRGYSPVYAENQVDADGNITYADFVIKHYGDWPAPEIFVINTPSTP